MSGFDNGFNYLFDEDETVIKYTLPYNPLKDEALYREAMDLDFGVQFRTHWMKKSAASCARDLC